MDNVRQQPQRLLAPSIRPPSQFAAVQAAQCGQPIIDRDAYHAAQTAALMGPHAARNTARRNTPSLGSHPRTIVPDSVLRAYATASETVMRSPPWTSRSRLGVLVHMRSCNRAK